MQMIQESCLGKLHVICYSLLNHMQTVQLWHRAAVIKRCPSMSPKMALHTGMDVVVATRALVYDPSS